MMDKNKAVHQLSELGCMSLSNAEDLYDSMFEKPVVPQCVANWYEEHKEDYDYELWDYFTSWDDQEDDDFKEWIRKEGTQPVITLVNMHQFGYEVDKEKRYTVRVKGINGYGEYLNESVDIRRWFFASENETEDYRTKHTRKELEEANFGWVFDCEGIEIEEVE